MTFFFRKIIFVVLISNAAMAANVNFDFRFESDSSSYNNAAKATGKMASTLYVMRTGRVDLKGKFNEELGFRLRLRFDKDDQTTLSKQDGFSNQVDLAYVQNQLIEGLSLVLGKFSSDVGSIEGNISTPDIYLQSQPYAQMVTRGFLYLSGAKLNYIYGVHEAGLFLANQSDKSSAEQSKTTYGYTYQGLFFDKKIKPMLGYLYDEKQSSTSETKLSTNIISAGVAFEPKPYSVAVDYILYSQKNISAVGTNDNWTTLLFEAAYDIDGVIPKFKYEMTDKKTGSASEKYDGVSLGVEYKPYAQDLFRYHLMVTQLTIKPDVGDAQYEQHLLVGTRIYADFLK